MSERDQRSVSDRHMHSADRLGLFSYIRLGKQRTGQGVTSSPTLDHPTGHYVWDFLNWGFTTPHSLTEFSKLQPKEKDLVPYSNMDQGRLFVRVSVQDLSTLQLAYQRGLAALQRAQAKVERLSDENHRLQAMVKNWSMKTTALTTESMELRQEIANIKQRIRVYAVPIEEHKDLISLLCEKICRIFDKSSPLPNAGLTFDELIKLVYSLPPLVQERLAECCPCFKDFVDSKNSGHFLRMQLTDAKVSIQQILELMPADMESAVLNAVVKDFSMKHGSPKEAQGFFEMRTRQRSNTDPRDDRVMPIKMTVSQSREDNAQLTFSDIHSESQYQERPQIPPRNYSTDDTSIEDQLNEAKSSSTVRDVGLMSSYHETTAIEEPAYTEVRVRCLTHPGDSDKSMSSSMGAPLAQSTPCGTMSRFISSKHQVNPPPSTHKKVKKKRKVSRWNFAARLCSSGKSATISDSESFDAAIYARANHKTNNKPQGK